MDVIVEFNQAAFDHSIKKEDILNVLRTKIYAACVEDFPEKHLVVGFDRAGNPLDDDVVYVFHAMKLRESTKKMAGL